MPALWPSTARFGANSTRVGEPLRADRGGFELRLDAGQDGPTLRDYARTLWRRKWFILVVVLAAPAAATYVSHRQAPVYSASADVLLRHDNFAGTLTGVQSNTTAEDPARLAQTQADLARVVALAQRVVSSAGTRMTASELLRHSSVDSKSNSDILTFTVRNRDPTLAKLLATTYASEYTSYRREIDTAAINLARREAESRISELKAAGQGRTALYTSLVEKAQLLNTMAALQTSNAYLAQPADSASKVSPRPVRNGMLAFALGLVLAVGLVFVRDTLDTRLRSADEIGSRLRLPLLARLPAPPRRIRAQNQLVTMAEPSGLNSEAFRVLRTNLDFVNMEAQARTIMITSAIEGEGKSTTAANLAVTLAMSGRRVVLVDLDLRRPFLDVFFGVPRDRGITQVALGRMPLESAVAGIPLAPASQHGMTGLGKNGEGGVERMFVVLAAGPIPPNPGEFVAGAAVADILRALRERADIVLIDAPPLLNIGDALSLSSHVDAMLLVTRLHTLRRSMLVELSRVLESCPAPTLGFVLAGAEFEEGYGYGYGTYGGQYQQPEARVEDTQGVL